MPHEVFLSYSSKNKLVADAVCARLEQHKLRCWIAPRDIAPGADWTVALVDAIQGCRVFVLIFSKDSNVSEQVKREVNLAIGGGRMIIPIRIEDVPLSKQMQYLIGTPHWLDAMTPPLEAHLDRLAATIRAALSGAAAAPPPATAAAPPRRVKAVKTAGDLVSKLRVKLRNPSTELPAIVEKINAIKEVRRLDVAELAGDIERLALTEGHREVAQEALFTLIEIDPGCDVAGILRKWMSNPADSNQDNVIRRSLGAQEAGRRDLLILEPELLKLCREDCRADVRVAALEALDQLGAAIDGGEVLGEWLKVRAQGNIFDTVIRLAAVKEARRRKLKPLAPALLDASRSDPSEEVRSAALAALPELGVQVDVSEELLRWLDPGGTDLPSLTNRLKAVKEIAERKLNNLAPRLRTLCQKDKHMEVRVAALQALEDLGEPVDVLGTLREWLQDNWGGLEGDAVRQTALKQIEQRKATALAKEVYQLARSDPNAYTRTLALSLLLNWRAKLDVPKLLAAWLQERGGAEPIKSVLIRLEALKLAVAHRCASLGEPILLVCRTDPHHEVRRAALKALLDLGITVQVPQEIRQWLTQDRSKDLGALCLRLEGIQQAADRRLIELEPELRDLARHDAHQEVRTKAKAALGRLGLSGWKSLLSWGR